MDKSSDSDIDENKERKFVKVGKRYCPHCGETISYKTYRAHRRRYFDTHRSVWQEQTRSRQCIDLTPPGTSSSPPSMDVSASPVLDTHILESPPHFHHDVGDLLSRTESHDDSSESDSQVCIGKFKNA